MADHTSAAIAEGSEGAAMRPRPLPAMTALAFGRMCTTERGFLEFFQDAVADGFGLNQANDHEFTDEQWEDMAMIRLNTLIRVYRSTPR